MSLQIRRVVTGHDANGRAVVKIDEVSKNFTSGSRQVSANEGLAEQRPVYVS